MSFLIKFSNESKLDLTEANTYYLAVSKELSAQFKLEMSETIDRIANNPEHFQKRYRNIKIVFTKVFPFGVHYLFEGNTVFIQRIIHQKRLYI